MNTYPPNYQLFAASPPADDMIEAARRYIESNGLTSDDVRMYKTKSCVIVQTKREVRLG